MKILNQKTGQGVLPTKTPKSKPAAAWENPLIPTKKLRQLYAAMVEVRLLEEHVAKSRRRKNALSHHFGEEACLASTVLSLNPGDLTSESSTGIAIKFLRGSKLTELLDLDAPAAKGGSSELPSLKDTTARLHAAIGAALALASNKKGSVTVAYVHAHDLQFPQWKLLLKLAAAHAAPILFVVLPGAGKQAKHGQLSLMSTSCGVPGIPVDAADSIALYRVAQESLLRARASGGPVLMECIPFQLPGSKVDSTDPIQRMRDLLLPRGVATEAWFEDVVARFQNKLNAANG